MEQQQLKKRTGNPQICAALFEMDCSAQKKRSKFDLNHKIQHVQRSHKPVFKTSFFTVEGMDKNASQK